MENVRIRIDSALRRKIDSNKCSREQADIMTAEELYNYCPPPKWIKPVPRFYQCLEVLVKIFHQPLPPVVTVRSTSVVMVVYGFVDASGSGFGSTTLVKGNINYRIGTWSSEEDQNSSNWREFENLVCEVEYAGEQGWLNNSSILFATDNEVGESCLYKGNSTSVKLFDLIVRLKLVEMKYGIKVWVTHVAGTRMQSQGTDGVSRGNMRLGVTAGKDMIEFCPWAKNPLEASPILKGWVKKWAGEQSIFLSTRDWFLRGHDITGGFYNDKKFWYPTISPGTYVWYPPPAAADVCLEELRKARMKRKGSLHIVIIQKLMTPIWRKQLNKAADCIFSIPASHSFWPAINHEPLIVALIFPYLPFRPFQLKGTPKMFYMGRKLSKMFQEDQVDTGDFLLKFLLEVRNFQTMPEGLVWKMLYFGQPPPFSCELENNQNSRRKQRTSRRRKDDSRSEVEAKRSKPARLS